MHIIIFFRDPRVGFPRFKSKKYGKNIYTTNCINGNVVVYGNKIKLPKIGLVRLKLHRNIPTYYRLKSVTVSQNASGKYYASILVEYEKQVSRDVLSKI